jgi:hypothetical protein
MARYAFPVWLFHPRLQAGLSRRTQQTANQELGIPESGDPACLRCDLGGWQRKNILWVTRLVGNRNRRGSVAEHVS